jgi:hypothetical protein
MTLDQTASLFIGAISGIGVAILQETTPVPVTPYVGLLVPVFSAVAGAITGYAVLHTTVKTVERDIAHVRADVAHTAELLRNLADRLARMEGRIDASS